MKLHDMNPFIRFAQHQTVYSSTPTTVSLDNRLFYVMETHGAARLVINNQPYDLCKDSLFLWKCGTPYRFTLDASVLLISINFDYVYKPSSPATPIPLILASDLKKEELMEEICFDDIDAINNPIVVFNANSLLQKINTILKEQQEKLSFYQENSSALLKSVIMEILRRNLFISDRIPQKIKQTIQFIQDNYQMKLTNDMIASHAGYHPYYLNRLMQLYTNHSLHEYVTNCRIEKSKELLLNTNLSISEIADACGFCSPFHFTNCFKKATASSPKAYRNIYL